MAFRFRLEKVLRHRRRQVDLRSREVATAAANVADLLSAIDGKRSDQTRTAELGSTAYRVEERRRCAAWITSLEGEISRLTVRRTEAETVLSQARSALQEAWREREVLEQLRLRREAAWQMEMARRERADLDEIGQQRALARQRQQSAGHRAELAGTSGTTNEDSAALDGN